VAKRAEPVGPTRLTRNFWRAGLRFSARYLKFARTRLARLKNGRGRVGAGMPAGIVIVIFYFFLIKIGHLKPNLVLFSFLIFDKKNCLLIILLYFSLKVHFSFDTRVSICLFSSVLCM
jgi:hypothetical protein